MVRTKLKRFGSNFRPVMLVLAPNSFSNIIYRSPSYMTSSEVYFHYNSTLCLAETIGLTFQAKKNSH